MSSSKSQFVPQAPHPSEQTLQRSRQVLRHNLITGNDQNRVSLGEGPPSAEEAAFLVKQ